MSSPVVHVQNISSQTSEKEIRDFFSFCGKITNLSVTPASGDANASQTATVTFEKETAAKTALLLDNTQLGASQVHVTAGANIEQIAASATSPGAAHGNEDEISQDDKPRARIFAEYLAQGYALSDTAIQRAIALDNQHGVSNRFTSALQAFDSKFKASERAQQIDKQYGLSGHAQTGFNTLHSYFEKAIGTPTGRQLAAFYTQGERQVRDVHNEARRLADLRSGKNNMAHNIPGTNKTVCNCGGNTGNCPCPEGQCHCVGCAKSGIDAPSTNQPHTVTGSDRTVCNCGGSTGSCPCAEDKCSCAGCAKNTGGTEKTHCNCGGDDGNCPCAPGQCGCSGCSKHSAGGANVAKKVAGSEKTTCNCGGDTGNCPCAPGECSCSGCAKAS